LSRALFGVRGPRVPLLDLLLYLYLPFALVVACVFGLSVDDSFITLRYVANFVHGMGLVWNPGYRVQGFTSPLGFLVDVLVYSLPFGFILLKVKLASLVFGVLAITEGARVVFGLDIPIWSKRIACLAIGTSWVVVYASGNGLETSLLMWLLMILLRNLVLTAKPGMYFLGMVCACAVLTRLDALLPIAGLAAVSVAINRGNEPLRRTAWFLGALVAVAVTLIGERIYFGTFLPSTYYAKKETVWSAAKSGFAYLWRPMTFGSPTPIAHLAIVITLVQALFVCVGVVFVVKSVPRCSYLIGLVLGQMVFIIGSGGDWMIGGRFLAPATIPLVILEVLGLVKVVERFRHSVQDVAQVGIVFGGALLLTALSVLPVIGVNDPIWSTGGLSNYKLLGSPPYGNAAVVQQVIPAYLTCLKGGETVATSEVGYLGYERQDLRIIDLRGLNNVTIARDAPEYDRHLGGVLDPNWYRDTDAIGRYLMKEKPVAIFTFDSPKQPLILGGQYKLAHATVAGLPLYVPTDDKRNCLK
jgi:hypothetical protein